MKKSLNFNAVQCPPPNGRKTALGLDFNRFIDSFFKKKHKRFFGCKFLSFRGRSPWNLKNLHPLNDDINLDCHCEECNDEAIHNNTCGLPRFRFAQARNDGKCAAFTLAEVLITLTIIGVIAAITIPNLMQKWEEQHTVSAVKEAYSILSNAFKLSIIENGYLTEWDWPNVGNSVENRSFLLEKLRPYLKISKVYGHGGEFQQETKMYYCGGQGAMYAKNLTGGRGNSNHCSTNNGYTFSLMNGMTINLFLTQNTINNRNVAKYSSTANGADINFGDLSVDINGYKRGPNRWGYDIFAFTYYFDGIVLHRDTSYGSTSSSRLCAQTGNYKDSTTNGYSCSYWIITKGNTEYQKTDVGNFTGAGWQGWK